MTRPLRLALPAAFTLVFLFAFSPSPVEARCGFSWQKAKGGSSCGARSKTQRHYAKLGRKGYRSKRRR